MTMSPKVKTNPCPKRELDFSSSCNSQGTRMKPDLIKVLKIVLMGSLKKKTSKCKFYRVTQFAEPV